jgi:hypothetical protein
VVCRTMGDEGKSLSHHAVQALHPRLWGSRTHARGSIHVPESHRGHAACTVFDPKQKQPSDLRSIEGALPVAVRNGVPIMRKRSRLALPVAARLRTAARPSRGVCRDWEGKSTSDRLDQLVGRVLASCDACCEIAFAHRV